jgi:hypothetical protein
MAATRDATQKLIIEASYPDTQRVCGERKAELSRFGIGVQDPERCDWGSDHLVSGVRH